MPSTTESKGNNCPSLTTQTEKPLHYQYLKEFRVEQCPLFLQHKCTQHKPFTCFYWHFNNQRRRRPVRKRDGTFNYSPDVYCTKYDETTGLCPDNDECPYLHRTAGDTERRYHLRYYKTGICVYDTDSRGYCVKNGPHCAFAHGIHDLRNPVYDIRELQAMEGSQGIEGNGDPSTILNCSGPNSLDKERNALNEDPRWQDTAYVLANYKTEICKRPPRLCRQGYACPQFHNSKDRRRSPKKYKYRSTPCPNVKQGDEWGDPNNCDNSDSCPYCHTRTEQQFHPEIYKSTKCNDIQQTGYCPRGPFCAFAHVEKEISAARDLSMDSSTDLAQLLSSALPPTSNTTSSASSPVSIVPRSNSTSNTNNQSRSTSTVASSLPDFSSGFDFSAPQPPLHLRDQHTPLINSIHTVPGPIARPRSYSTSTATTSNNNDLLSSYLEKHNGPMKNNTSSLFSGGASSPLFPGMGTAAGLFYPAAADTVGSVVGSALEDLNLDDINLEASLEKDLCGSMDNVVNETNSVNSVLRSNVLVSTAPVNIPGARLASENRMGKISPPIGASPLPSSLGHGQSGFGVSPFARTSSIGQSSLYDFTNNANMSPSQSSVQSVSSQAGNASIVASMMEVHRLQSELAVSRAKCTSYEDSMAQARKAVEAWKRESEDTARKIKVAESQRDEALARCNSLQAEVDSLRGEPFLHVLNRVTELSSLPSNQLKQLQTQLKQDLEHVEQVIMQRTQNSA